MTGGAIVGGAQGAVIGIPALGIPGSTAGALGGATLGSAAGANIWLIGYQVTNYGPASVVWPFAGAPSQ